jgi:hypothetical protein
MCRSLWFGRLSVFDAVLFSIRGGVHLLKSVVHDKKRKKKVLGSMRYNFGHIKP